MGLTGVDVSNNNGGLSVMNLKPEFVFAKASEGINFVDQDFAVYRDEAARLNVPFGAYHFFHAESLNARAEADLFCHVAQPQSGRILWLDYETYGASGQADAEEIGYFIDEVKVNFPQAKVGLYANMTGIDRIVPYLSEIPFNGFWFAQPDTPSTAPSPLPPLTWQVHQYTQVNGVDWDYWNWDLNKIEQYYAWS